MTTIRSPLGFAIALAAFLAVLAGCTQLTVDKRVQLQFEDAQFPESVTVDAGAGVGSGAVADATGEAPSGAVATSPGGNEVAAHSLRGVFNVNVRYTSDTAAEDISQEARAAVEAAASVAAGQGTQAGDSGTGDAGGTVNASGGPGGDEGESAPDTAE